jgi:hypothetical protein
MEEFDRLVNENTQFLNNPYISSTLMLFLVVYSSAFAPRLPNYILKLFDYTIIKFVLFFLIVFISRKNATIAILASIALIVSVMALNKFKFGQEMMSVVSNGEKTTRQLNLQNCDCKCDHFNELIPTSSDGKLLVTETQKAVIKGDLHPKNAELLVKKVVNNEKIGNSVFVAETSDGTKKINEINKNIEQGKITPEEAKKNVATIIITEAVEKQNNKTITIEEIKQLALESEQKKQHDQFMLENSNIVGIDISDDVTGIDSRASIYSSS